MPGPQREELEHVIAAVAEAARDYLAGLDQRAVIGPRVEQANAALRSALPEHGDGALTCRRALGRITDQSIPGI